MSQLAFILKDLQDTAVVLSDLQGRIAQHPDDDILKVNAETLLKRRHDLELQLHRELRVNQFDLISYRIEPQRPGPVPPMQWRWRFTCSSGSSPRFLTRSSSDAHRS
jgi:hypothetical protein